MCQTGFFTLPPHILDQVHITDIKTFIMNVYVVELFGMIKKHPLISNNLKSFKMKIMKIKRLISRTNPIHNSIKISRQRIMACLDEQTSTRYHAISQFELMMATLMNIICDRCHSAYVSYGNTRKLYICDLCKHETKSKSIKSNQPPIWIDDNLTIKYDIPLQLQGLTLGEKILIQKYSPYIPILHIRCGYFAIKGHCICFPKDVASVCTNLPRINFTVITYIRHYGTKNDEALSKYDQFIIRKVKVMDALLWLKQNNVLYKGDDLVIDVNNL